MDPLPPLASRRARPPSRFWRRAFLAFLVLVVAGGGFLAYFVWSASSGLREVVAELDQNDPRWRLEELEAERKALPDDQNSALQILAIKKITGGNGVWTMAMEKIFPGTLPPQVQLNDQQVLFLEERFEALKTVVPMARKLKDMPEGRFPIKYSVDGISTVINCQDARECFSLLEWDAARRVHAYDADGAMESCLALHHACTSLGDEPTLITQLVRYAGNAITVHTLERVLAQGEPAESSLKKMQLALEKELREPTFLCALRGERAISHRLMTALAEGKVNLKGLGAMLGTNGFEGQFVERMPGYMARQHGALLRYLTKMVEAGKLPLEERNAKFKELESTIMKEPTFVRLLAPAIQKVSEAHRRTQTNLRAANAGLAAERYRLANKRWPKDLDELVKAGLLEAVSSDPYDGKLMRLKHQVDGIVIYSVGMDGVDNGGFIDRDRPMDPGTDQGFRLFHVTHRRQPPNPPVEIVEDDPLK